MVDILEPTDQFRRTFRDAHRRNTADFFEELVRRSGVDEADNAKTVAELRVLESRVAKTQSRAKWWRLVRGVVVVSGFVFVAVAIATGQWLWLSGAVVGGVTVFWKLNPLMRNVAEQQSGQIAQRDQKLADAWRQMESLNRLYSWDIASQLIQKTVPRIQLDPYFANARLGELKDLFGLTDNFNADRSVQFVYSGVLNGNPFVIAQTLRHWMGARTYHGALNISWTEQVRGPDGNMRTETRFQTLHASIIKPFPEYAQVPAVILGSEAAPDLCFTREPSKHSMPNDGFIERWRSARALKKALRKLEAKSRGTSRGNQFTLMSNRDFEIMFGATDRNHEVQFRLLFTALAQQEIVKLLKDQEVGYGDNFIFIKSRMINLVQPAHLSRLDISANPAFFQSFELAQARRNFSIYHNELFRSIYFSLAPLLSIPIYQQHRSHADIYRDTHSRRSCFWEHEAIACHIGERHFRHESSVTKNILKTSVVSSQNGFQKVRVNARGYTAIERVEFVSIWGGDGRNHHVPVPWSEYLEVEKDSEMLVAECPSRGVEDTDPSALLRCSFENMGIGAEQLVFRRSILTALL